MVSANTCNWHPGGGSPGEGGGGNRPWGQRRNTSPYLGEKPIGTWTVWELTQDKAGLDRGPLQPCEGPCFIPWGEEGWGCAGGGGKSIFLDDQSTCP